MWGTDVLSNLLQVETTAQRANSEKKKKAGLPIKSDMNEELVNEIMFHIIYKLTTLHTVKHDPPQNPLFLSYRSRTINSAYTDDVYD